MKGLFGACAAFAATALFLPGSASAQAVLLQRCTVDSLDSPTAQLRDQWARRCALRMHVVNPANGFDTGTPASNGGSLIEYEEPTSNRDEGLNAYSGQLDALEVNNLFINNIYKAGPTTQNPDSWAPTSMFKEWGRQASRMKARPLYPTYGTTSYIYDEPPYPGANGLQLFPSLSNDPNDCRLFTDSARTQVYNGPFYVNGFCESSCYTPEQKVLFSDGYAPIVEATKALRTDMMTLTPDSSLDDVRLTQNTTQAYTKEIRDAKHPIVEISTASGGLLRVTVEHPVINGEGRLVEAQTLRVGDELLKADGSRDAIVKLNNTEHFGRVYNLRPATTDRVSNLLVAEGYLVGSSLFQNDEVGYLNRIILHRVSGEVIP